MHIKDLQTLKRLLTQAGKEFGFNGDTDLNSVAERVDAEIENN